MVGISFDYLHEPGAGFDGLNTAQIVRTEKNTPPVRSRIRIKYGTAEGRYGTLTTPDRNKFGPNAAHAAGTATNSNL
jgi:hypothetical protein